MAAALFPVELSVVEQPEDWDKGFRKPLYHNTFFFPPPEKCYYLPFPRETKLIWRGLLILLQLSHNSGENVCESFPLGQQWGKFRIELHYFTAQSTALRRAVSAAARCRECHGDELSLAFYTSCRFQAKFRRRRCCSAAYREVRMCAVDLMIPCWSVIINSLMLSLDQVHWSVWQAW